VVIRMLEESWKLIMESDTDPPIEKCPFVILK
jgi:hypothetical protein